MTLCAVWSSYASLSLDVNSEPDLLISLEQYGSRSSMHVPMSSELGDASSLAKVYASNVRLVAEPEQVGCLISATFLYLHLKFIVCRKHVLKTH